MSKLSGPISNQTSNDAASMDFPPASVPIITVDGPSGSGKGTIGVRLAKALGWHFLDSGAVYRALALLVLVKHLDPTDESNIERLAASLDLHFEGGIFLEGKEVSSEIRSEECSQMASKIAIFPKVREILLKRQRDFRHLPGLVADGRDMGTVVFPEAHLKFYLEASPEERAKRRFLQLKGTSYSVTLQHLLSEIRERDERDKSRAVAPLKPAKDAVVIDTTGLGVEAVFEQVMSFVRSRFHKC